MRVDDFVKINAHLGRLGGLLKLWLTNDERTATFGEPMIRAVPNKIADTQDAMHNAIRKIVLPRSKS